MKKHHQLVPLLVVKGAANALDFYARAMSANVVTRYEHGTEIHVSHADLELGLLRRAERERCYTRVDDAGFESTIHVIDAPREVRRERVRERNRTKGTTFSMVVSKTSSSSRAICGSRFLRRSARGRDVRFVGDGG
jgi:uncharacterized glyoxalase superfamily protein PhnB